MSTTNAKHLASASVVSIGIVLVTATSEAKTLHFAGYEWTVKNGADLKPGPNDWSASNAWVDSSGALHLEIAKREGKWQCAEVVSTQRLGFGKYQFQLVGRIDQLDKNVVLGLFTYPPADVGPDGTNEIDIEFARWGHSDAPNGNNTVWPAVTGIPQSSRRFALGLTGAYTTHRFTWKSGSILFQSLDGHHDDDTNEIERWLFSPASPYEAIPQEPVPPHLSLWLFKGAAPSRGVEVIVSRFTFTPA
jgi:hypothetical protein